MSHSNHVQSNRIMFILEKPYVSKFLKDSAIRLGAPVLDNFAAREALAGTNGARLVSPEEFRRLVLESDAPRIYSNSENASEWISENLSHTKLPRNMALFKDKAAFRDLLRDLYPEYRYLAVDAEGLDALDPDTLPYPFIIKPAVGFFSLGVHRVDTPADWSRVKAEIASEISRISDIYPEQVLDLSRYIIEDVIEGEEFAVDAYYGANGEPIILNILAHRFASAGDVSDRVYVSSKKVIDNWREPVGSFLAELGRRAELADFPVHAELRVGSDGVLRPIEVNPMRFAGWCVADFTFYAWGFDPYEYYLKGLAPDWSEIFKVRENNVYGVVVCDLPPGLDRSRIISADYEALAAAFTRPLEVRRIDWTEYSVFAFVFAETSEDQTAEFDRFLGSDLTEFLKIE